jgi:hypothetical protein
MRILSASGPWHAQNPHALPPAHPRPPAARAQAFPLSFASCDSASAPRRWFGPAHEGLHIHEIDVLGPQQLFRLACELACELAQPPAQELRPLGPADAPGSATSGPCNGG